MMTSSNSMNFSVEFDDIIRFNLFNQIYSGLIHIQMLFHKFHRCTKFRPEGLSLAIIMGKVHVFIVLKLMTSSEFLYTTELSKIKFLKINLKNWGGPWKVVHGRWSMKWSIEGVHRVVHRRGPRVVHGLELSVFNSPVKMVSSSNP